MAAQNVGQGDESGQERAEKEQHFGAELPRTDVGQKAIAASGNVRAVQIITAHPMFRDSVIFPHRLAERLGEAMPFGGDFMG